MATVYKVEIKTVSAWQAYPEDYVKEMFEKFLKEYEDEKTGLGFENSEVEVKKIA